MINSKFYIGSSYDIHVRWGNHITTLLRNECHTPGLQKDWNEYGRENFDIRVLEICSREQLKEKEQEWLDKTEATVYGYNKSINSKTTIGDKIAYLRGNIKEKYPDLYSIRSKNMIEINKRIEIREKRREQFIKVNNRSDIKQRLIMRNKDPIFIAKVQATRRKMREERFVKD